MEAKTCKVLVQSTNYWVEENSILIDLCYITLGDFTNLNALSSITNTNTD